LEQRAPQQHYETEMAKQIKLKYIDVDLNEVCHLMANPQGEIYMASLNCKGAIGTNIAGIKAESIDSTDGTPRLANVTFPPRL